MKILRIIPSMDPQQGGPCQGIRNAIPELHKLGVQNEVVCLDDPNSDYLGKDPFQIHALGKSNNPWNYNKALIPWLLAHFQRFEAVIIHGLWLYHSHAAIKAMMAFRKTSTTCPKVYVMPHGMLDPYFQKAKERRLKALRNVIYWKVFENKLVNQADGILFTCEEELVLARTTFPNYKPQREINVGYGIQPPPRYDPTMRQAFAAKVPQWNGKPHFIFLSRIHPKKGVDLLIKAYLQLEKELGSLPQLIIAGPGLEQPYGEAMQELAAGSTNILFPGMLSGDAKWGAFFESEAFVLPSHQENFGIAVVEALACAKPVLISDKVNIWREIEKGKGGIVKNDTEADTYQALKQWMSLNKGEKTAMSKSAQGVYQGYFTIAQAALQFRNGINL
ncbi:glycosyltransferase [Maribacter arenosus]|uniref:Glycosyltransferase n=1 Tax=Maribacter arenosus TaxID=1854708 RepID=A0ABR7VFF5_9FLAO|nr:glycosyltransferase [Maribacter arenosus]MBD0850784.1 glycosyltransferase [Maribacter arenosus]